MMEGALNLIEVLTPQIMLIEDYQCRQALKAVIQASVKPEFLTMPASRSNHHPPDERVEGGLLLHTKRVLTIANIIIDQDPDGIDVDGIRMACILHDAGRPVSHAHHPRVMHDAIMQMSWYDPIHMAAVAKMVLRHMGRWGEEMPETQEEWIVHTADNIAAKYYI